MIIMANKKTKKDFFKELRVLVEGNEELTNFIDHELELLSKKSNTSSKVNEEHIQLMATIKQELAKIDRAVTISELQKESDILAEYSNQKLSAMFKKLVDSKEVIKEVDKKRSYFKLAE